MLALFYLGLEIGLQKQNQLIYIHIFIIIPTINVAYYIQNHDNTI